MKGFGKIYLLIFLAISPGLFPSAAGAAKTLQGDSFWEVLETRYTLIHYQSVKDLQRFNKNVDYSPDGWGLKLFFSNPSPDKLGNEVAKKVDALYERAQVILGMRKKSKKVKIMIYSNSEQKYASYKKIYMISSRSYRSSSRPRAWYIYEYNTIYVSVDDLHEGMVAHEMAHSIIDHHLLVRPPKATAEILAGYVDSHLFD